jgi:hypothetical protein
MRPGDADLPLEFGGVVDENQLGLRRRIYRQLLLSSGVRRQRCAYR